MKYLLILLTLVTSMTIAQDLTLFEKKTFTNKKGESISYRILFPERYDKTKKYSVVLFLHGSGERGSDNEKQLVHGAKLFLAKENREKYPAIIIFPQCPENSWWASEIKNPSNPKLRIFDYKKEIPQTLKLAIELTKHIIKSESVDKNSVYISGLSMGGMGTFEAVYRFPKMFTAAAPICGAGDPNSYSKKQTKTSFWIFHGDQDKSVDVENSRLMYSRLKNLKANVLYTEYPNVGHDSWTNAFAEPEYLKWLFSKKSK
jgi:predicted peptidase